EVPQVTGLAGPLRERGQEEVAIQWIHVPVAVAVAEQPEEAVYAVASRQTITISVQLASHAIMDPVRSDRQAITAVRQRAADDVRSGKGEDRDRPAIHDGCGDIQTDQCAVLPAQLKRAGVDGHDTVEGDSNAVDHRALGGTVVDDLTPDACWGRVIDLKAQDEPLGADRARLGEGIG